MFVKDILSKVGEYITADNIALLSVIVTILIFVISRFAEIRYKKRDDKKAQYIKLIELMQDTLNSPQKDKNGQIILSEETKRRFFDTGASLLMYGSKKVYRNYLLFREISTNPLMKQCKYYDDSIVIYIIAEILVAMRKEVGLSYFNSIANNEALAFFINDISANPIAKDKGIDAKFRIKMIKFELFMIDRTRFIYLKRFYNFFIKPIFAGIVIVLKYFFLVPLGFIISKLFPKFSKKVRESNKDK